MMKIGLLSLPMNFNYGGILQQYALQRVLRRIGHDVTVISRRKNRVGMINVFPVWFKWKLINLFGYIPFLRFMPLVSVQPFKRKYLNNTSKDIYSNADLHRFAHDQNFEAFVVGSDQVWSYTAPPHIRNNYLDFSADMCGVKRISYAASFGKEEWLYSDDDTKACCDLVQAFDAVSVREDSGVTLCKKYFGVDAEHHLDPTMLLEKEEYLKIIDGVRTYSPKGGLLNYILDSSVEKKGLIDEVASLLGTDHYSINFKNKTDSFKNMLKGHTGSVEQWLRNFSNAEFVLTDSFHGTIFSIIFNKPFVAVANKERGVARFTSVLRVFGLEDRLIYNVDEFSEDLMRESIDWDTVNSTLVHERIRSLAYLNAHLYARLCKGGLFL